MAEANFQYQSRYNFKLPTWFLTSNVTLASDSTLTKFEAGVRTDKGKRRDHEPDRPNLDPSQEPGTSGHNEHGRSAVDISDPDGESGSDDESGSEDEWFSKAPARMKGEYKYNIHWNVYSELLDTVKQCLTPVRPPNDWWSEHPTILLRTPIQGCTSYIETVIKLLAKDVVADLVSFDSEDLIDVSLDLSLQDSTDRPKDAKFSELPHRYFGSIPSSTQEAGAFRTEEIISAFTNCPTARKSAGTIAKERNRQDTLPPSTLIYIKDARGVLDLPKGDEILKSLSTHIRARRKENERILLLVTMHSVSTPLDSRRESWENREIRHSVLADKSSIMDITPVPKSVTLERRKSHCIMEMNIRHLKRALRRMLPEYLEHSNLTPTPHWVSLAVSDIPMALCKSVFPPFLFERASRQMVRHEGRVPDLGDMQAVLTRLVNNVEAAERGRKIETNPNDKDSILHKKLAGVRKSCDAEEKKLLHLFVDPAKIRVTLEDVVIDPKAKEVMKQLLLSSRSRVQGISRMLQEEIQINGTLLYGLPGTGKTHLARAIAKDMAMSLMAITPADITSKFVGETEKCIKTVFSLCLKMTPCILFIDEADSLFTKRSSTNYTWDRAATNQFLQEMDGIAAKKDAPFVLVATNRPMDLDEAFLRRLPYRIQFQLPSKEEREKILINLLEGTTLDPAVKIDEWAKKTEMFSGSDLKSFCRQAALIYASEHPKRDCEADTSEAMGSLGLQERHFSQALERTHRSTSIENQNDINEFTRSYSTERLSDDEVYSSIYDDM
ncbi:P-loop containing nucleoside triphosphate hydrolase protein [Xylaria cubensis]|nr:P-loop containing nucleoside triphosphate hydrolase protein [Xylaria cubensis]